MDGAGKGGCFLGSTGGNKYGELPKETVWLSTGQ